MNNILRNFMWFCAGTNRRLLLECETDHSKYFAIGATVFFTAAFAVLSSGYALYFVFSGSPNAIWFAIGFGLLWGMTIFNIDRYLVLSIRKENKPWKEFWQAIPRILLAIMVGIVIARPLELKIFDKEIKTALRQYILDKNKNYNQTAVDNFKATYKVQYDELEKKSEERDKAKKDVDEAQALQDAELAGTQNGRTSGKPGPGPRWREKCELTKTKTTYYLQVAGEVSQLETEISGYEKSAGLDKQHVMSNAEVDSLVANAGFFDRNKVLGQISSWTPFSVFSSNKPDPTSKKEAAPKLTIQELDGKNDKTGFFISLLFIIVECLPIIVKLMARRGSYDMRLSEEDERIQFLARHETYANKHLVKELALAQREVLTKAIEQWQEQEMNSPTLGSRYIQAGEEEEA